MAADVESDIKDWSTTASNNKPTGSTPISTNLDDNLREIQAAVRQAFEDSPWFDYGHTYTYSDADTFTISTPNTDQTAVYHAGRRIKAVVTAGTVYGYITSSSFSMGVTTVNVSLNNSASLDAGLSAIWVGSSVTGNPLNLNASPGVVGLVAFNNITTPASKIDLSCHSVTLRNPTTGHTFTKVGSGGSPALSVTNDLSTTEAVNGRDASGALANSWIHIYIIWNGATFGSLASTSAPLTGPTLPSGYTHWAYALSVYFSGTLGAGGSYRLINCRGNRVLYGYAGAGTTRVLNGGQQTSMTGVNVSTFIPPATIPGLMLLHVTLGVQHTSESIFDGFIRPESVTYESNGRRAVSTYVAAANQVSWGDGYIEIPNMSQNILYRISSAPATSGGLIIEVDGYTVPNGG